MISYGKTEWIPQMKALWHQTFGDDEQYLEAFFSKIYQDENTLVYVLDKKVAAILFMIPYQYRHDGTEEEAVYLYALATAPKYRGQTIMTRLIHKSIEISRQRGYAAMILIPSEKTLFNYYSRFGFQTCSDIVKVNKSRHEVHEQTKTKNILQAQEGTRPPINLMSASKQQLWNAYKNSEYYDKNGILLSEEQNAFYYNELTKEGGEGFVFDLHDRLDGYVLLKYEHPVLEIYETNIDKDNLVFLYQALEEKYQYNRLIFYQPVCFDEAEIKQNRQEFAMALSLRENSLSEIFINRVLM